MLMTHPLRNARDEARCVRCRVLLRVEQPLQVERLGGCRVYRRHPRRDAAATTTAAATNAAAMTEVDTAASAPVQSPRQRTPENAAGARERREHRLAPQR
jgi:hypothetical protein